MRIPRPWEIPEREAAPEHLYLHRRLNRRKFLASLGVTVAQTAAVGTAGILPSRLWSAGSLYPARRNSAYPLDRPITNENDATHYNNFAEFDDEKEVWRFVHRFQTEPWTIRISGLVAKPQTLDLSKVIRQFPLEERLYRMRCVEGWSIAVPWTGFPFNALIDLVQPTAEARYVRLVSFLRPDEAPNQKAFPEQVWPRFQGLSVAEAMNELIILATGIYGHELPKQSGAPIRLVVPWKYGFKSLKSITAIEFTDRQPQTFWNNQRMPPSHFVANVNPNERYLDRSQAREKIIGTLETRPTEIYNGYGRWVADLYAKPQQG
jgi:sulfoxide reductase catalytic subunit YedY